MVPLAGTAAPASLEMRQQRLDFVIPTLDNTSSCQSRDTAKVLSRIVSYAV